MMRIILPLILIVIGLTACAVTHPQSYIEGGAAYSAAYNDIPYEDYDYYEDYEYEAAIEEVTTGFVDDALAFIEFVENVHPIFVLPEMLSQDYYYISEEFIHAAYQAENQQDFNFAMQRFVRVLRDGHMTIAGFGILGNFFLDIEFTARDNRLFLLEAGEADLEVIKIGGIPTQTVLYTVDRYFYYENEASRNQVHAVMSRGVEILHRAGAEIQQDITNLTIFDGAETYEIQVSAVESNGWRLRNAAQADFIINYGMINDDVFLIDLRSFRNDPGINSAEIAIRTAIDEGVRHFVFDVRNNSGGHSYIGTRLLRAMGVVPPSFGSVTRVRSALNPDLPDTASRIPGSTIPTRNPNDVTIAVLTNVNTFSSARWVSAWVQDGGLGVIVGEPGANSPTAFGNMGARVNLPHSGMDLPSSTTLWLRPDGEADQSTIWPDIYVPYQEALEAALEFFANQ